MSPKNKDNEKKFDMTEGASFFLFKIVSESDHESVSSVDFNHENQKRHSHLIRKRHGSLHE